MILTKDKEIDCLLVLLDSALKGDEPSIPEDINIKRLLKLAINQQVYNTVLPVLKSLNRLNEDELKEWNAYRLSELKRTLFVNNEREIIEAELNESKIKYMYLKGLVIREYYPQTFMRQMSDNDIFYDESKRKELYKIMKSHGYFVDRAAAPSDDFCKDTCKFEFHRSLFDPNDKNFAPNFNPIERAIQDENKPFKYNMTKEDNYIYTISHMYKHYLYGGCGFRFICDLYLLTNSKDDLNWEYINSKIDEFGLTGFQSLVIGLCEAVFGDKPITDDEKSLVNVMLNCSVYNIDSVAIKNKIKESGGKLGYLLHRMFPKKQTMLENYINLSEKPYLLPFYYIYRIFQRGIFKHKEVKKEIKSIKNIK